MKTERLNYYLPPELVAQRPVRNRSESRLLVLQRSNSRLTDSQFSRIGGFLRPGDCLVLNDTRVLPARFFARRQHTTGKIEGLFLAEVSPGVWEVMLKGAHKIKQGEQLCLKDIYSQDFCKASLLEKRPDGVCRFCIDTRLSCEIILNGIGFPPLPPYIKRDDNLQIAAVDRRRYQTVYARKAGAVAAPTAGLHFTKNLIKQLKQIGICFACVTLHIGMGTFKPIIAENLQDHTMHKEQFEITEENARIINQAKKDGGRIIAVGTTSVRTLETIAKDSKVQPARGATELFIMPGYRFQVVDAIITNFHLPKSTLLALVAAFTGLENVLAAYNHAIQERYRFYSYGDAMLIL